MSKMSKFTIVGPASLYEGILTLAAETFAQTGEKVRLSVDEGVDQADQVVRTTVLPSNGRHKVVYQVLDPRPVSGRSKAVVQSFLIARGPASARQIQAGTGLAQKAVESAVHGLKVAQVIRPVAVIN
jgi:hypothetical protein